MLLLGLASLLAGGLLLFTACQYPSSKLFQKTWVLEQYGTASAPRAVVPGAPPAKQEILLSLDGPAHFSGNDGCNLVGGAYKLGSGCAIQFDSIQTTMMMCQDAVMQQAGAINGLFQKVRTYKVTDTKLELRTPEKGVLRYRKQ